MDALIWFARTGSFPGQYLRVEADALEVTWDDVDEGNPFCVEGNERVIQGIIADARRDGNIRRVVFL